MKKRFIARPLFCRRHTFPFPLNGQSLMTQRSRPQGRTVAGGGPYGPNRRSRDLLGKTYSTRPPVSKRCAVAMCTAAQAESFLRSEGGDPDLRIGPVIVYNTLEREGHSTFSKFWRSLMISQRLPRVAFILIMLVLSACHSTHAKKLRGGVVTMKNG